MKRLFAAIKINPDENFLRIYYELMKELHFAKINWVKPENMHLTLKFFGEIPEDKIELINKIISLTLSIYTPFIIEIKNTRIFGSSYNPKVIWFGTDNSEILTSMAEDLLNTLNENDFFRDRQNFVPHLTVGRIKDIENNKLFQSVVDHYKTSFIQKVPVESVILFESLLSPGGAQYKKVNEFSLSR